MSNPLIIPILNYLKSQAQAVSEHELLTQLERQGDFEGALSKDKPFSQASELALFQKHFLIMNALYHLQAELMQEQWQLHISPLKIYLAPLVEGEATSLADSDTPAALKAYYLDLSNLENTDEQGVADLLKGFWQRYLTEDKQLDAYQALEINPGADLKTVKLAYRRLVKVHHPDCGGDRAKFIEVRTAYEVLKNHC